jgi:hypothetical protein
MYSFPLFETGYLVQETLTTLLSCTLATNVAQHRVERIRFLDTETNPKHQSLTLSIGQIIHRSRLKLCPIFMGHFQRDPKSFNRTRCVQISAQISPCQSNGPPMAYIWHECPSHMSYTCHAMRVYIHIMSCSILNDSLILMLCASLAR